MILRIKGRGRKEQIAKRFDPKRLLILARPQTERTLPSRNGDFPACQTMRNSLGRPVNFVPNADAGRRRALPHLH